MDEFAQARSRPLPGFLESIRAGFATFVDLLKTRVEILSTELEEERERLEQILLLSIAAVFCLGFGVILLTLFAVMLFWEQHRLAVLGGFSLLYIAAGLATALLARRKAKEKPRLFSATLGELAKDQHHLCS